MNGKWFVLTTSVLTCFVSYYIYMAYTWVPPVPELDFNEWWGARLQESQQDTTIRPFEIEFSDVIINDLRERLMHRRPFAAPLEGAGFAYGFNSDYLERILDFWKNSYDFKGQERYLNKFPQFKTNIQGLKMHYVHVRPNVDTNMTVLPLLLLHGWPGSVREFYEMIPLLTTPRDSLPYVFEVIAPSLPGFGYSQAPSRPGLGSAHAAVIIRNLMHRIGHKQFYIHGGDFGANIGTDMSILFPQEILGFHSNFLVNWSVSAVVLWFLGALAPRMLVEKQEIDRMYPFSERLARWLEELDYMHPAIKPDTVGIALTNCPAGLAAYILEKFSSLNDPSWKRAQDGQLLKRFSLTELLDNVMIYWTSSCITTSMRLYAQARKQSGLQINTIPTYIPVWGIKFKHEVLYQPDILIRLKYKNLLQSTIVDDGGHFGAMENPKIMADDIFRAGRAFLEFNAEK